MARRRCSLQIPGDQNGGAPPSHTDHRVQQTKVCLQVKVCGSIWSRRLRLLNCFYENLSLSFGSGSVFLENLDPDLD